MSLSTLRANLSGNILTGKETIRAGKGTFRTGKATIREDIVRPDQDF